MSLAVPWLLVALVVPAGLVGAYVWQLRRRRRTIVRHPDVALLRVAGAPRHGWKRHVPVAVITAALALFAIGAARPQVSAEVPVSASSIIIALDVSGSMCSTDVQPNRLTAATSAVRAFIKAQHASTQIGLVLFSGSSQLAVPPTQDRSQLNQALATLSTGRGTTIGAAILTSVDAIAAIDGAVQPVGDTEADGPPPAPATQKVPEIVVLLTDGANTNGVTPEVAATLAASRGVRVYPIGFGTTHPSAMVCTAEQAGGRGSGGFGGGGFGGGGYGGGGFGGGGFGRFQLADEPTLQQVAKITDGEYFKASDADQLNKVLADLPRHVQTQHRDLDISAAFAALGTLLMLGAVLWQWRSRSAV